MNRRQIQRVSTSRHVPTYDAERINRAVYKATIDRTLITRAADSLSDLRFPAFKEKIMDYARTGVADTDIIALLECLDGYREFRDEDDVRRALEEIIMPNKEEHQISNETRQQPDVRTRDTSAGSSIKERAAVNQSEERKDYPEVTPTAMSNFVCDMCGKDFQNQQDLIHHREYERTGAR